MVKIHCIDARKFQRMTKILIKIKNKKEKPQSKLKCHKIIFRIPFWIFLLETDNYQNINRCLETSEDTSADLPFLGRVPQICPESLNILLHAFCDPTLSLASPRPAMVSAQQLSHRATCLTSQCAGFILRLCNPHCRCCCSLSFSKPRRFLYMKTSAPKLRCAGHPLQFLSTSLLFAQDPSCRGDQLIIPSNQKLHSTEVTV